MQNVQSSTVTNNKETEAHLEYDSIIWNVLKVTKLC
jgi:hypothetical protein